LAPKVLFEASEWVHFCLHSILRGELELLGKLLQEGNVEGDVLEKDTGMLRKVHLVDNQILIEKAKQEVFLHGCMKSLNNLRCQFH